MALIWVFYAHLFYRDFTSRHHPRSMYAVAGFVEKGAGAQFYNSSLTVKDGTLVHLHR